MARPPTYSQKQADAILEAVCNGASLTEASAAIGVPRQTVRSWLESTPDFASAFEAAKLVRVEALADEINILANSAQQIASDAVSRNENPNAAIAALRCTIDAKRWLLSKLNPAKFGDRSAVEVSGAGGAPLMQEVDVHKAALSIMALLETARPPKTIDQIAPTPQRLALPPMKSAHDHARTALQSRDLMWAEQADTREACQRSADDQTPYELRLGPGRPTRESVRS